jgi:hypothetical protein
MIIQFLTKKIVKVPSVILMLIAFTNLSFTLKPTGEIILPAGTIVPLETIGLLSSAEKSVGQMVELKVRSDVKVGNVVAIPAGSIAKAQITRVKPPKGFGKEGFIEMQVKTVRSVDGQDVNLSSGSIYKEGDDKQTLSIVLGIFVCILFLLMKGKNAEIAPGYQVDAVVSSNITIKTN